jgi:hypothetical protein
MGHCCFSEKLLVFLLIFCMITLPGCSAIGSIFGSIFGLAGDLLSWGMQELPRLLPYLLFLVEREPLPEEQEILLARPAPEPEEPLTPSSQVIATYLQIHPHLDTIIAVPLPSSKSKIEEIHQEIKKHFEPHQVFMVSVNALGFNGSSSSRALWKNACRASDSVYGRGGLRKNSSSFVSFSSVFKKTKGSGTFTPCDSFWFTTCAPKGERK